MLRFCFYSLLCGFALALAAAAGVLWYIVPQLPPVAALRDVQLQTPLKVYTADGKLIAEFGEKRRNPVAIEDVPLLLKQAFIAAEDDRFYQHPGVDWMAIARAMLELAQTREKKQGGSTITMQVARNFFLSPEKTYERKLKEVVLAYVIERELSKDEILELYLNKIFLGQRAYGVAAAAQVYYGLGLAELDLAQIAMIAGLPKAPSKTNPIANPQAARERREYVLGRMLKLGYIDEAAYAHARTAPAGAQWHGQAVESDAPYVAEMVRDYMLSQHGEAAYTSGYRVFVTVPAALQDAAVAALRKALYAYDARHGYRGAEAHVELASGASEETWRGVLQDRRTIADLVPAVVVEVADQAARVFTLEHGLIELTWAGLRPARRHLSVDGVGAAPQKAAEVMAIGDIVRVQRSAAAIAGEPDYWRLTQIPAVEGALVSLDPNDGRVLALVGGFAFERSTFNRVTQARRQPGSNFKPFIYSAALDRGYTAASFINDAPIVFDAPGLETAWRPENYAGGYNGPTRLREALTKSRNLVSIRLLRAIGVDFALDFVARFGFQSRQLPHNLSLALGSGEVTPWEIARGYAVLANGGYRVEPYFIARIENAAGKEIFRARPATVCVACDDVALEADGEPIDVAALRALDDAERGNARAPRVLAAENAWVMSSMLQDVIKRGTGARARELERGDLAGKTGTTNDQNDAWFSGFNRHNATTVWVGFDRVAPLGKRETGAQAALPMWIDFMRVALAGVPETRSDQPAGMVTVRIDPDTGLLVGANHPRAIFESFPADRVPGRSPRDAASSDATDAPGGAAVGRAPEQIF